MIDHLDHLVLTTADEAACVDFYTRVLGMALETFVGGTPPMARKAFTFGAQKINLHVKGHEFEPKAHQPVPGALDLCFLASIPLAQVIARLEKAEWPVISGPVLRTGATQKIRSIYVRDPDLNLIEISEPA
jgi:catechol 2,3-dioxygenase-like lactoylglutathione lyase family enzyme